MKARPFREIEAEALAEMTATERAEFDAASANAEARLKLAQLVYDARTRAGLTQAELAARMGTRQNAISAIENAAKAPSGITLQRVAAAVGGNLTIAIAA